MSAFKIMLLTMAAIMVAVFIIGIAKLLFNIIIYVGSLLFILLALAAATISSSINSIINKLNKNGNRRKQ